MEILPKDNKHLKLKHIKNTIIFVRIFEKALGDFLGLVESYPTITEALNWSDVTINGYKGLLFISTLLP